VSDDAARGSGADGDGDAGGEGRDRIALRASGIEQAFGDVEVLAGVDLTVERGEVAALVGPNGSGKSTLIRVLAGLDQPTGGDVVVPPGAGGARRVGYLPQQPAFRGGFTARDTLDFYASLLPGVDGDDVDATLERIGLADVADRAVGSLSGGMTRLLGLGQAVLGDPAVLLLDEPGSGLDPAMVERLFGVLGDLAAGGTAVVVASHELPAVEAHADTVYVLDDGGFVASGAPAAIVDEAGVESLSAAFLRVVRTEGSEATVRAGVGGDDGTSRERDGGESREPDGAEVSDDE